MSLRLPPQASPVRELFAIEDLAALADPAARRALPTFRGLLHSLQEFVLNDERVSSAAGICLRADGELWLIRVFPTRTSCRWARAWNFGKL